MSSQQRPARRNGQPRIPLILFGAFDRHNFGDLLLGRIAARTTGRADAIAAGLAARELRRAGGFAVAALDDIVAAQAGHAFDLLQVGGEILGCSRYEAAVMLLAPDEAARIVARLDRDTAARDHWAVGQPGTARELPYVASRAALPGVRRILHAGIGGVELETLPAMLRDTALARLREADRVWVRDAMTRDALIRTGLHSRLAPDPATLVARLFSARIARWSNGGGMAALRARFPQGYLALQFSADFGDDETLRQLANGVETFAAARGLGIVAFCAGRAPWHDDPAIHRRLRYFLADPARLVSSSARSLWALCALIAESSAVCASSLHARIVGEALARPVVTLLRTPRAGRKQSAYARTWDPDGLNPLARPEMAEAALAGASRVDPALRTRHARQLADHATEAWQWLLAP
ncbi:polysaccharide pyruvyl transferase family protein [Thauera humireducens]|uniref:polysaccharide pyruvyl transferase family protein n=1 Tax=Thauera humireducens TaxID=1134435 RepID=UPI00311D871D